MIIWFLIKCKAGNSVPLCKKPPGHIAGGFLQLDQEVYGIPQNGTPLHPDANSGLQHMPASPPTSRDFKVDPRGHGSGCSFISSNFTDKLQGLTVERSALHICVLSIFKPETL